MKKRILLGIGLLSVFMFLTGCSEIKKPITSESSGFWNEYIVYPLSWVIKEGAHILGGSFGLSIIVVTILI
ncbi:MAG: OxaA precursor, partial [Bacillus sp. (in: firmicutes)]